jgi:hypothetical protein
MHGSPALHSLESDHVAVTIASRARAQRRDGLRPELEALLKSHTRLATGLATTIEPIENESCSHAQDAVADVSVSELEADGSKANVSCFRGSGQ